MSWGDKWGSEGTASVIVNLATGWDWVASELYVLGKEPLGHIQQEAGCSS